MAETRPRTHPIVNPEHLADAARRVVAEIDQWLSNDDWASMETIDEVLEWRNALAVALGLPKRE